jgi:hypothetical protein
MMGLWPAELAQPILQSYCIRAGGGTGKCSGVHVPHFKAALALHPSSRAAHLRRHAFLSVVPMLLQAFMHSPKFWVQMYE